MCLGRHATPYLPAGSTAAPSTLVCVNNTSHPPACYLQHDGAYDGFDPEEFPSRSGGKREAVQHIKKTHGYQTVVMVGDGITDFEARAPGGADAFIG